MIKWNVPIMNHRLIRHAWLIRRDALLQQLYKMVKSSPANIEKQWRISYFIWWFEKVIISLQCDLGRTYLE